MSNGKKSNLQSILDFLTVLAEKAALAGIDPIDIPITIAFAILRARGISEDQAKERYLATVDKIEALGELPMDLPE